MLNGEPKDKLVTFFHLADVPTLIPTAVIDYLDAHTIKINLEVVFEFLKITDQKTRKFQKIEGAFVYVFEFATVGGGEPEDWMFAVSLTLNIIY